MKLKRINPWKLAATFGIFGLAFAQAAIAQTVVFQDDFEDVGAVIASGTGLGGGKQFQYAYRNGTGQGGWTMSAYPYFYTSYYATAAEAGRAADPLTALSNPATAPYTSSIGTGTFSASAGGQGNVALGLYSHTGTISQTLNDVQFTLGQTYTFYIETATANGANGTTLNLQLLAGSGTAASVTFNSNGGFTDNVGNATNVSLNTNGFDSTNTTGNWQQLSFSYTPQAGDAALGQNMTLQINLGTHIDIDNIVIVAVPEPSTVVLACIFGTGILMLFRRRSLSYR